jgi:DNA-binding MarR family transcriptional regulator
VETDPAPGEPGRHTTSGAGPPVPGPGDLHGQLLAAFRAHSLESELFLHAVADRLDMTTADFVCLTLLLLEGPCTAGRLAERTGLSTGAITGVVDRLSGQGRVQREVDPADRRRVVVEPVRQRAQDLAEVLGPMVADARRLHDRFRPEELEAVLRFVGEARQMLARHTTYLRSGEPLSQAPDGVVTVPKGKSPSAVLHVVGLPSRFRLAAADLGDELCRVDLGGRTPSVRAWSNHVMVQFRGRARAAPHGELLLHQGVRWTVEINGGCSHLDVDLRPASVAAVLVRGGARQLELDLPAPDSVVPVRVLGGAVRMVVRRPAGVPVGVRIRGGASEVMVDGARVRSASGGTRFVSGAEAVPGYEVELHGGASRLVIESY